MECSACKYQYKPGHYEDKPIYYKIGPKKGHIRKVESEYVCASASFVYIGSMGQCSIYMCPKCNNLQGAI